jgi:hypothetical protein
VYSPPLVHLPHRFLFNAVQMGNITVLTGFQDHVILMLVADRKSDPGGEGGEREKDPTKPPEKSS